MKLWKQTTAFFTSDENDLRKAKVSYSSSTPTPINNDKTPNLGPIIGVQVK